MQKKVVFLLPAFLLVVSFLFISKTEAAVCLSRYDGVTCPAGTIRCLSPLSCTAPSACTSSCACAPATPYPCRVGGAMQCQASAATGNGTADYLDGDADHADGKLNDCGVAVCRTDYTMCGSDCRDKAAPGSVAGCGDGQSYDQCSGCTGSIKVILNPSTAGQTGYLSVTGGSETSSPPTGSLFYNTSLNRLRVKTGPLVTDWKDATGTTYGPGRNIDATSIAAGSPSVAVVGTPSFDGVKIGTGAIAPSNGDAGLTGDMYLNSGKALRIDSTNPSELNVGNYNAAAGAGDDFILRIHAPVASATSKLVFDQGGVDKWELAAFRGGGLLVTRNPEDATDPTSRLTALSVASSDGSVSILSSLKVGSGGVPTTSADSVGVKGHLTVGGNYGGPVSGSCSSGSHFIDFNNDHVINSGECYRPSSSTVNQTVLNGKLNVFGDIRGSGGSLTVGGIYTDPATVGGAADCPSGYWWIDLNGNGQDDLGECYQTTGTSFGVFGGPLYVGSNVFSLPSGGEGGGGGLSVLDVRASSAGLTSGQYLLALRTDGTNRFAVDKNGKIETTGGAAIGNDSTDRVDIAGSLYVTGDITSHSVQPNLIDVSGTGSAAINDASAGGMLRVGSGTSNTLRIDGNEISTSSSNPLNLQAHGTGRVHVYNDFYADRNSYFGTSSTDIATFKARINGSGGLLMLGTGPGEEVRFFDPRLTVVSPALGVLRLTSDNGEVKLSELANEDWSRASGGRFIVGNSTTTVTCDTMCTNHGLNCASSFSLAGAEYACSTLQSFSRYCWCKGD